jgi:pantoate--beta-alanine ligase
MHVLETVEAVRQVRSQLGTLGMVPTMGYLHEGHLSLVRKAKQECGAAAVSIFVNPTQFGANEDLSRYPRDLERDLSLLRSVGTDLVFVPSVEEMYPNGFSTFVDLEGVTSVLEGAKRPGHFRGVATVVTKLLNIVQPNRAYFGQKDAQQTIVIRTMVRDLNIPTEIVIEPIVREADGLAMSSRNVYLTPEQRAAAPVLYQALLAAQQRYQQGERNANSLRSGIEQQISSEPLAQIDYVSIAHPWTLQELEQIDEVGALISLAVRFGNTRLIDNIILAAS